MKKNEKERGGLSRRKFLRNAGLVAGGTAAFGLAGVSLGGCGVSPECQTSGDQAAAPQTQKVDYFGECVCPGCGATQPHPRGTPCRMLTCPGCGQSMGRAIA